MRRWFLWNHLKNEHNCGSHAEGEGKDNQNWRLYGSPNFHQIIFRNWDISNLWRKISAEDQKRPLNLDAARRIVSLETAIKFSTSPIKKSIKIEGACQTGQTWWYGCLLRSQYECVIYTRVLLAVVWSVYNSQQFILLYNKH